MQEPGHHYNKPKTTVFLYFTPNVKQGLVIKTFLLISCLVFFTVPSKDGEQTSCTFTKVLQLQPSWCSVDSFGISWCFMCCSQISNCGLRSQSGWNSSCFIIVAKYLLDWEYTDYFAVWTQAERPRPEVWSAFQPWYAVVHVTWGVIRDGIIAFPHNVHGDYIASRNRLFPNMNIWKFPRNWKQNRFYKNSALAFVLQ